MQDVRKADPTFTGFVPRNAVEAVDRYVRCRKNGLKPMLVPECLIECAKGLDKKEMDLFEAWIINPNGSLEGVQLVPCDQISAANEAIYIGMPVEVVFDDVTEEVTLPLFRRPRETP